MTERELQDARPVVFICGPGEVETLRDEIEDRERWCFGCRHRHQHRFVVRSEVGPSYYPPWATLICPCCNEDRTTFPGFERHWDIYE